jgi:hypothetical protein
MPTDEPQDDISIQETELRDAANEISKARNERQREVESRPIDAKVEVQSTDGVNRPRRCHARRNTIPIPHRTRALESGEGDSMERP